LAGPGLFFLLLCTGNKLINKLINKVMVIVDKSVEIL